MLLLAFVGGEFGSVHKLISLSWKGWSLVAASCVVGGMISYSGLKVQNRVSATSFTVEVRALMD